MKIIKQSLYEGKESSIKVIYFQDYSASSDKTYIIKQVYKATSDSNTYIDVSEEVVGWHWGDTSPEESARFIGKLKAVYNDEVPADDVDDIINSFAASNILIKVGDN